MRSNGISDGEDPRFGAATLTEGPAGEFGAMNHAQNVGYAGKELWQNHRGGLPFFLRAQFGRDFSGRLAICS